MGLIRFHDALVFVACLGFAVNAHAFSDPHAYADGVEVGGGGGRWFTGSTADGYGCDVCHTGSAGADLSVTGLPLLEGYNPGQSYEVFLLWPETLGHVSLLAEFTDELRHGAGQLALPRPETLQAAELCAAEQGGLPGSELHEAADGRALVSLLDCGTRALRFQWTAPPSAAGPVWFDAGFVFSNEDGTAAGDGVTLVRRSLWPHGQTPARRIATGCSVLALAPGMSAGALALGAPALLVLELTRRLRVRRRAARKGAIGCE